MRRASACAFMKAECAKAWTHVQSHSLTNNVDAIRRLFGLMDATSRSFDETLVGCWRHAVNVMPLPVRPRASEDSPGRSLRPP
jgi:hypothetical protein